MRIQEDTDGTTSPRIFISYRRDDTAGHAGHLYADLVAHFGADSVFMDTETIEPGADFTVQLSREIASCNVLIALIGKQWLQRRLRDPEDYVRLEIQAALDRNMRVIPILLQGARMPSVAQLPGSIAELSHKNALEISNSRWRHDVDKLIPALQRRAGTTPSPSRRLTNLPLELTSFIGRRAELQHLQELQSQSRLLALIGPGGVGKTRLAIQLATYLRARFSDGVWLVELASITDESLVPQAVAAALDVPEQAHRSLEATLEDHLRDRETLLVLDNCEHLVQAAARLVQTLLRTCPKLNLLTTSREPLNVPGEVTWWVAPLEESDAVQLFLDRAGAVGFELPADGLPVVAGICRRLDGLPLAIELAAARSHMMAVQDIDARLSDRFQLLTGGSRTAAERQRTLEAAVDWSYDQLPEPGQPLFVGGAVAGSRPVRALVGPGRGVPRQLPRGAGLGHRPRPPARISACRRFVRVLAAARVQHRGQGMAAIAACHVGRGFTASNRRTGGAWRMRVLPERAGNGTVDPGSSPGRSPRAGGPRQRDACPQVLEPGHAGIG